MESRSPFWSDFESQGSGTRERAGISPPKSGQVDESGVTGQLN
jgi:hypothetical protein